MTREQWRMLDKGQQQEVATLDCPDEEAGLLCRYLQESCTKCWSEAEKEKEDNHE